MFAMLLAMTLQSAAAPATPVLPPAPDAETLATGVDWATRMTLPTQVNGHGPYAFTIDTGADRSVVSDALASELKLPQGRDATVFGIDGEQPVSTVKLDKLIFGRSEHRSVNAPVLPRGSLGAQGFIGLDALAKESVVLDFHARTIRIAHSPTEAMVGDPDVIVVTGKSRFGQLILTDASIGKMKVYAIIDTGAENSIGNLALREMLGRSGPLDDKGVKVVSVTGTALPAEASHIRQIRMGGMTLYDMPIAYADVATFHHFKLDHQPAILIGMDVLRTFQRVAVDFQRRSVRFKMPDRGINLNIAADDQGIARQGTANRLGL